MTLLSAFTESWFGKAPSSRICKKMDLDLSDSNLAEAMCNKIGWIVLLFRIPVQFLDRSLCILHHTAATSVHLVLNSKIQDHLEKYKGHHPHYLTNRAGPANWPFCINKFNKFDFDLIWIKQYAIIDVLGNVLTMLRGDLVVQSSVDVVQVSQYALRQLDNLLVPVWLRHLKQCWIEDRQNDSDVVTDHCGNVLIGPERQHSLGDLTTISPFHQSVSLLQKEKSPEFTFRQCFFCKRICSGTHILIFDWRPQYSTCTSLCQ